MQDSNALAPKRPRVARIPIVTHTFSPLQNTRAILQRLSLTSQTYGLERRLTILALPLTLVTRTGPC